MILTSENYHSTQMRQKYLGVSQYKDFVGSLGQKGCEAMAVAKVRGEWDQEMTTDLMVGSYVDAHFESTLDVFKAKHPEMMTKNNELKAEYKKANKIIARVERDTYFMKFMAGAKQVIMTGKLFEVDWKIKIDSLDKAIYITDLKCMAAIRDSFWVKDYGYMSFVPYWGYDIQAAVYQKIVELNTGKKLPFFIAACSKEKVTDLEIIGFRQQELDDCISTVGPNIKRIIQLKAGEVSPDRCELCDYCKLTKVLVKPVHYTELLLSI